MAAQTVKEIKKELYLMMHKAEQMLELSEEAFAKNMTKQLDQAMDLGRDIHAKEDELTAALAKMAASDPEARTLLSIPGLVEKAATSIERIADNTRTKIKEALLFSDKANQETSQMIAKAKDMLKKAGEALVTGTPALVAAASQEGDSVIRMANDFATAHEDRLVTGECSPKSSSTYLCMLYAFEDLAAYTKDALRKISAK